MPLSIRVRPNKKQVISEIAVLISGNLFRLRRYEHFRVHANRFVVYLEKDVWLARNRAAVKVRHVRLGYLVPNELVLEQLGHVYSGFVRHAVK